MGTIGVAATHGTSLLRPRTGLTEVHVMQAVLTIMTTVVIPRPITPLLCRGTDEGIHETIGHQIGMYILLFNISI